MNKILCRIAAWCAQELIWGGELLGSENLPVKGPAVFVCNHLGALGPIAAYASLPFDLHFWIHADMLDPQRASDYLRLDFVEPQLHVPPPLSHWLAAAISKIHVPLLHAIGGIPVYQNAEQISKTFDLSLDILEKGGFLLIFPEDAARPADEHSRMSPFKKGFARLGELYYERTRQRLPFYPLAVHAASLSVQAGKPVYFNPLNPPAMERLRIKNALEHFVCQMYLQAEEKAMVHLHLAS
jgi:1-acyl-sn-glycerol-3-phosphate acyltransferase